MYKKNKEMRALKEERTVLPQRRRTQSFSSSLLDAIYRSIDDEPSLSLPNELETVTTSKKQSNSVPPSRGRTQFLVEEDNHNNNRELNSLRRAILVETWMERQKSQRTTTTSSSDSSRGGGGLFTSSSETGSSTKGTPRTGNVTTFQGVEKQQQKNIKKQPTKSEKDHHQHHPHHHHRQGLDFTRTKLKALKIYGELKKVKQPISPGGRIASFLNSIFSPGTKKVKMCSINGAMEDVSFGVDGNYTSITKPKSSSCSTTSSFSRSCLSKTPTPGKRSKRSVRFYPVSVIVGEDSRPCGHKRVYGGDPGLMPITTRKGVGVANKSSGPLVTTSKEKKKNNLSVNVHLSGFGSEGFPSFLNYDGEEEEEEDDDMSCSSSELFELDHLIGIGNGRFREELPVYETTSFKTNQAIANCNLFV